MRALHVVSKKEKGPMKVCTFSLLLCTNSAKPRHSPGWVELGDGGGGGGDSFAELEVAEALLEEPDAGTHTCVPTKMAPQSMLGLV